MTSPKRRTGRRPGDSGTREAILRAARLQFAAHGYRGATTRGIAAEAGVDPALIRHFFADKDGVFAATLELPADFQRVAREALSGPSDLVGERLARVYLGLWEDPDTGPGMAAAAASALSNPQAMHQIRGFLAGAQIAAAMTHLPANEAARRLSLAGSHLLGTAIARHIIEVPALTDMTLDTVIAAIAPAIQRYLTEPLPTQTTIATTTAQPEPLTAAHLASPSDGDAEATG